jgi:hypothetical protein
MRYGLGRQKLPEAASFLIPSSRDHGAFTTV